MIDKKYQNKAIGRCALAKFLQFFFEKHGNVLLHTSVNVNNPSTISLYESQGFKKLEEFKYDFWEKTYHEVKMVKK